MYYLKYFLLVLLAIMTFSCSSSMNIERKYYDNGQLKSEFKGEKKRKKSGKEKTWYENGSFQGFKNYKNGFEQGHAVSYHSNGNLLVTSNWEKGKLHGEVKFYREDGIIEYFLLYKKGQLQEQKWYDKKGNLFFCEKYDRKKGFSTVYRYSDGKIISQKTKPIGKDDKKELKNIKLRKTPNEKR